MRLSAALACALVAAACKDGEKRADNAAPPARSAAADAAAPEPELRLLGCAPAQPPPGVPPMQGGRSKPDPFVKVGAPVVKGPLAGKLVATTLERHRNRLQFCYEQNLIRNPSLEGSLVLTSSIEPAGNVFEAHVEQSFDEELSLCLKHIISELRFPAAPAGAKDRTTLRLPLQFAWEPGRTAAEGAGPAAWTPFAKASVRPPLSVAAPAAANFPPSLSLGALDRCLGTQRGTFRSLVSIATDGSVTEARTGGLGHRESEDCISKTLLAAKSIPGTQPVEIACDFQRGDAAPWRVTLDAGYTVIEPGKDYAPTEGDAANAFVVVLDPKATSEAIDKALAVAARGVASIVALRADAGAPLYVAAGPQPLRSPDAASRFTLDAGEPLVACGGPMDAPATGTFAQADKVIGAASRRCTHRPCPAQLTISVAAKRTAYDLAALAGAARSVDFERIMLGPGSCPR